ncbi:MAG: exodeoxyribonuclease VII small subunit [Eubacteriales bacterium]|nr:exodeoxyribonuclease VII small subunit [Eubacteriales bacterium]
MQEAINLIDNREQSKLTYEQAISQLEKIVSRLESGDVSLDESVKLFQQGTELSRFCATQLAAVEHQISQLIVAPDGSVTETPFGTTDV